MPGSDTIPFWGLALLLITAGATAIAVSALWPPIHYRRFVTAAAFALVALSCVFVDRIPNVRLPMQVVVVAECGVLDRPGFRMDMQKLGEEPVLFREVGLRVLATGSGDRCPKTPPEFPGLEVSFERVPPDREASLEHARAYLDANRPRHWAAWPRTLADKPRIVFAHAPAGPLAPPSLPNQIKSLTLTDGRKPVLYEKSYGSVSFRSVRINITPAAITEEDRSRGIMIELADPRLHDATQLDVTFKYRTVSPVRGACAVKATGISERTISLSGGRVPITPGAYDFAHLDVAPLVGLPRLDVFLKDPFPISGCGGLEAWLALDIEFNVALAAGGAIGDRRTVMVPILPTTGVTLVTPDPAGHPKVKAQRVAAPGWEHDAKPPGFGFDGGPGITNLLETLFATLRPEACGGSGCTAISPSFLQRTKPCWFRGVADTLSRSGEFRDCLARTRRLVVVGIDAPRLLELDRRFGIEAAVSAGHVDVMVAAPVHDADRTDLPGWVPKVVPGPTLRTEPRVHLLVSTRDTLRMKTSTGRSGLAAQRAFFDAVASGGLIGPSGEQPTRGVPPSQGLCVRGESFPEGGGLAWFAHSRVPRQPPDLTVLRPSGAPKPEVRLKGAFLSPTSATHG